MSWDKILGQRRIKKVLSNAIVNNRISSSYLFIGPEGVGKEFVAIELVKVVNCAFRKQEISENGDTLVFACETCKSCQNINKLSSENLLFVFPLPTTKNNTQNDDPVKDLDEQQYTELKEELKQKVENKYHKISLTNATQIKINSVRDIKRKLAYNSSQGERRFVVIQDADSMTSEAANAFLKTLEEPSEQVTIILISSNPARILQTILSRCQQIQFEPIESKELIGYLVSHYQKSESEAALIAKFSEGSLHKALSFIDEDVQDLRGEVVELLRTCVKKKYRVSIVQKIEEMVKTHDKNKIDFALKLLIMWLRDVIVVVNSKKNQDDRILSLITNQDEFDVLSKFASLFSDVDFAKIIDIIEKTSYKIYQNVNLNLMLLNLMLNIRAELFNRENIN